VAEQSSLVRLQGDYDLEVDWRGFELHPDIPPGGVSVSTYFPRAELKETQRFLAEFAAQFGIDDLRITDHIPNTRRALAMAEYARALGALHAFRQVAMDALWRQGRSLEADSDLRHIATQAGLDAGAALLASDEPRYLDKVDLRKVDARTRGVTAIPAFFFGDNPFPVVGCQPYERLARAAELAGANRRPRAKHNSL
jgi:predicted DsbA family dithiol-disulfide isomerase